MSGSFCRGYVSKHGYRTSGTTCVGSAHARLETEPHFRASDRLTGMSNYPNMAAGRNFIIQTL
jgi:hypothetical protein